MFVYLALNPGDRKTPSRDIARISMPIREYEAWSLYTSGGGAGKRFPFIIPVP